MIQTTSERGLKPSVLDRLLGHGGVWTLESAKEAVKRDLEWLLNSRRVVSKPSTGFKPLAQSLVTYGLPDLASLCPVAARDQQKLRMEIQETIKRFEPRLMRVRVTLEAALAPDRSVRFRIDALLRVEPEPEPVVFDSVLRLDDQTFEITDEAP
jgi:type VI secretion system protein ImpF